MLRKLLFMLFNLFLRYLYTIQFIGILVFCFLVFCWSFKLHSLPGLHGDEAWAGILGSSYNGDGIRSIFGMNHYTGILEALSAYLSFNIFGTGIAQLRLSGVLLNLIGLGFTIKVLYTFNKSSAIIFLLFISQSAIYLLSPRIAWEVNSFTMIFIAAYINILKKMADLANVSKPFLLFAFLLLNLLGIYNHMIFASIPLSGLLGLIMWSSYNRDYRFCKLIFVMIVNLGNCAVFYMITQHFSHLMAIEYILQDVVIGMVIIFLEVCFLKRFFNTKIDFHLAIPRFMIWILISIGFLFFLTYHGHAVFDIIANYKVFLNVYSYKTNDVLRIVFTSISVFVCGFSIYCLLKDLNSKGKIAIPAFVLTAYMSTFSLFTTNNSVRYYLIIIFLLFFYLSLKIPRQALQHVFYLVLFVSFGLSAFVMARVFTVGIKGYNVSMVRIGNGQNETSGHFLPKKNLVDSLSKYHIGKIDYIPDRYFIEQPILFYKIISPWKEDINKQAFIDYRGGNGGFIVVIKK